MNLFIIGGIIGPWQIILIIVALVILFGGRKIPELMKGIGQGISEFKNATKEKGTKGEDKEDEKEKLNDDTTNTNKSE